MSVHFCRLLYGAVRGSIVWWKSGQSILELSDNINHDHHYYYPISDVLVATCIKGDDSLGSILPKNDSCCHILWYIEFHPLPVCILAAFRTIDPSYYHYNIDGFIVFYTFRPMAMLKIDMFDYWIGYVYVAYVVSEVSEPLKYIHSAHVCTCCV